MTENEKYPGENALDHELKDTQISFYRWGTWTLRILVMLFLIYLGVMAVCLTLVIFSSVYIRTIIQSILDQIAPHSGSY